MIIFYFVMIFLLTMLINVYTLNLKNVNVSLYAYDVMLIFVTCNDIVFRTKLFLGSKFEMKDMGEANVILGVRVIKKGDSILLS